MSSERTAIGFTLFATAIGSCSIAWVRSGIVGVWLPEADEAQTRRRISAECPAAQELAPTPAVQAVVEALVELLRGEDSDLTFAELDMESVSPFERRVYEATRAIPAGSTLTYGDIAVKLGQRGAVRAVGRALGRNPFPLIVPCHRVLAAGGGDGGFSAPGGVATKRRLLAIEASRVSGQGELFAAAFDEEGASPQD
jgi:methylated-DNA-[protein]-cysteine S-methyltransferase